MFCARRAPTASSSRPSATATCYGLGKASIAANLDVSEVGDAQTIAAPRSLGSYSSLQLALSALAEAVR